eukprot:358419-Chlamydomonas_euryale.AAC.2
MPLMGASDSESSRAECMLERAMVFQRRRDYRRAVAQVGWVWGRCGGGVMRMHVGACHGVPAAQGLSAR